MKSTKVLLAFYVLAIIILVPLKNWLAIIWAFTATANLFRVLQIEKMLHRERKETLTILRDHYQQKIKKIQ